MRVSSIAGVLMMLMACTAMGGDESAPREAVLEFWTDEEALRYLERLKRWHQIEQEEREAIRRARQPDRPAPDEPPPGIEAISVTGEKSSSVQDEAQAITAFSADDLGSITNTQERGIDEGDLVKRVANHLLLLRRGRLFSFEIGVRPGDPIKKIGQLDLVPVDLSSLGVQEKDGWYDEIISAGQTIVVVGYSYEPTGTELVIIDLQADGELVRRETYFLPSFDYYSYENYTTRLIGNDLLFYMPIPLASLKTDGPLRESLPYLHFPAGKVAGEKRPLLSELRIHSPLLHTPWPILHTIVRCPLDVRPLSCRAQGVIGSFDAEVYVSPGAVYLWMGGQRWYYDYLSLPDAWIRGWVRRDLESGGTITKGSLVYRLPLDGGSPGAVGVDGAPVNQFSFREKRGALQLVLQHGARQRLHVVQISLNSFGARGAPTPARAYEDLPGSNGGCELNRFVGDYLLYGACIDDPGAETGVMVKSLGDARAAQWIETGFHPSRVEAVGTDALIVGHRWDENGGPQDLGLSALSLHEWPRLLDTSALSDAAESEWRSHGFNHAQMGEHLILGLPMQAGGWHERWLPPWRSGRVPGEVRYFEWTASGSIEDLGSLRQSRLELMRPDGCKVSCIDWYGAARPLFMDGRILALIDYEVIEGSWGSHGITELQRSSALDP